MAVTRRIAMYVIAVAVFAVIHAFLLMAWMSPLEVGITRMADVAITDVQFGKDCLNVTLKNYVTQAKTVNKVLVYQVNPRPAPEEELVLAYELVHEPILVGEEISIRINFNWISGYRYQVELEKADTEDFNISFSATAP